MQSYQIVFVVRAEDIAAINHAVQSDPEQQPGETPGEAWVRRNMQNEAIPVWQRMKNVCDKADKYREAYAIEAAAMGADYMPAATKQALADIAQRDETAAEKLAVYAERLQAAITPKDIGDA